MSINISESMFPKEGVKFTFFGFPSLLKVEGRWSNIQAQLTIMNKFGQKIGERNDNSSKPRNDSTIPMHIEETVKITLTNAGNEIEDIKKEIIKNIRENIEIYNNNKEIIELYVGSGKTEESYIQSYEFITEVIAGGEEFFANIEDYSALYSPSLGEIKKEGFTFTLSSNGKATSIRANDLPQEKIIKILNTLQE